jgi:glutathione synthase
MMNGRILEHNGVVGALRRIRHGGDIRANLTAGGKGAIANVNDRMKSIAIKAAPQLERDGMFLVGLDVVGNKIIEINVFSPGALVGAMQLTGVNFMQPIIDSLEHKVDYMRQNALPERMPNQQLAVF